MPALDQGEECEVWCGCCGGYGGNVVGCRDLRCYCGAKLWLFPEEIPESARKGFVRPYPNPELDNYEFEDL